MGDRSDSSIHNYEHTLGKIFTFSLKPPEADMIYRMNNECSKMIHLCTKLELLLCILGSLVFKKLLWRPPEKLALAAGGQEHCKEGQF